MGQDFQSLRSPQVGWNHCNSSTSFFELSESGMFYNLGYKCECGAVIIMESKPTKALEKATENFLRRSQQTPLD